MRKCFDYERCESKKCKKCQRNAIIRICAHCRNVYIKTCLCDYGASYGAYFVIGSWLKVYFRLLKTFLKLIGLCVLGFFVKLKIL
jgi:hypothetical protein